MNSLNKRLNGLWTPFVFQLLAIMFMVEFTKGALLVSILPVYFSSVLGLSVYTLGWAFAMQYIGDNVLRGPVGWAIDQIGYRLTMAAGLALTLTGVCLLVFCKGTFWMIVGSFLLGAGTSPLWPSVLAGTTSAAGKEASGTIMGAVYVAWMAGAGTGPVAMNFMIRGTDFTLPFRVAIAVMAAVFVLSLFLPKRGKAETKDRKGTGQKKSFLQTFRDMSLSPLLYPAMFLQTFALGLLTPIITLYAREDLKLSPNEFSLFLIVGGAATLLFFIPVGRWTDRWGTRWFLHAGIPLSAAATVYFAFVSSRPQLFAAVIAVGIGYALFIPAWNALLARMVPKERRGMVWGVFLTIEGAGFVVGPVLSGKLWDVFSHRLPFLLSGAVLLLLFVLHFVISIPKKGVIR